jgi:hypothetical protein
MVCMFHLGWKQYNLGIKKCQFWVDIWQVVMSSKKSQFCNTCLIRISTTGLEPIGYRGALLSSLLQVYVYITHNLLNVLVQIANKMGFKKIEYSG